MISYAQLRSRIRSQPQTQHSDHDQTDETDRTERTERTERIGYGGADLLTLETLDKMTDSQTSRTDLLTLETIDRMTDSEILEIGDEFVELSTIDEEVTSFSK